ncbi:MAG: ATP-binding protein, partial [Planctomycetota bacterium]
MDRLARKVSVLASGHGKKATRGCPCGHLGDAVKPCRCTPQQVDRYRARLSGPLLDRLDLTVEVAALRYAELTEAGDGETSATVRGRVLAARARQHARARGRAPGLNGRLPPASVRRHCRPNAHGGRLL